MVTMGAPPPRTVGVEFSDEGEEFVSVGRFDPNLLEVTCSHVQE